MHISQTFRWKCESMQTLLARKTVATPVAHLENSGIFIQCWQYYGNISTIWIIHMYIPHSTQAKTTWSIFLLSLLGLCGI